MFEYPIIATDVARGRPESKPTAMMSWNGVISTVPQPSSQRTGRRFAPITQ